MVQIGQNAIVKLEYNQFPQEFVYYDLYLNKMINKKENIGSHS